MPNQETDSTNLKEKPLVSVIIPTHNRARLLQEALNSVYAQEGVGEQLDMEVIVVDDASSDETPDVVRRYPGIRYIRLATNRGGPAALNAGIKTSAGKYVTFLDDDDLCLPHKLRIQVQVLERHPGVGVVYGQNIIRDEGDDVTWPDARRAPSGYVFYAFLMGEWVSMDTLMVRREAFEKSGNFDETPVSMYHQDMFLRLAFHFPFAFIPGNVAINRVNKRGVFFSRLGGEEGYSKSAPYVLEKALALLPDTAESHRIRQKARAALVSRIFNWLKEIREFPHIRTHVRIALQTCPWMLKEPLARASMVQSLRIAGFLDSPIAAVGAICQELRAAAGGRGLREWLEMRRLLADVWTEAANGLHSRLYYRTAGYAAAYAVLHDPTQLTRKIVWKLLIRGVLAALRWDPIIAVLKRKS